MLSTYVFSGGKIQSSISGLNNYICCWGSCNVVERSSDLGGCETARSRMSFETQLLSSEEIQCLGFQWQQGIMWYDQNIITIPSINDIALKHHHIIGSTFAIRHQNPDHKAAFHQFLLESKSKFSYVSSILSLPTPVKKCLNGKTFSNCTAVFLKQGRDQNVGHRYLKVGCPIITENGIRCFWLKPPILLQV